MEKLLKIIAVLCAISVALVTGSLYVKGVRDDIHEQEQLNHRLNTLCDDAKQSDWSEEQRSEFIKRHCASLPSQQIDQ